MSSADPAPSETTTENPAPSTSEDPSGTSTSPAPDAASTPRRIESYFPLIELTGGPHGRKAKYLVDGVEQRGVTRVVIDASVNDAIRVQTFQIANVDVLVTVKDGYITNIAQVVLQKHEDEGLSYEIIARYTAPTLWEAVQLCADALRTESEQAGSTGDTVETPERGQTEEPMDKTKKAPIPERTPPETKKTDPTYVRGTIDPPTKKKG